MKQLLLAITMMFSSFVANAQITGTVVDAGTAEPLPGATVVVKVPSTEVITPL